MRVTPPIYRYTGLIAGLGLLALLVGLILLVVLPDLAIAAWLMLALGVGLLAAAFVIDFRKVSGAITGKRGRFSAGATVMVFIFIGITLLVNAISISSYKRFDTTELSQFTLTSQTKDVLAQMEIPVEAVCFFVPGDPYGIGIDFGVYAKTLLEEYQEYTEQLGIRVIDPDEHPDEARAYNIYQYQTIVFESELGRRVVTPDSILEQAEHAFTSAILEVTGITQKTVYFLSGHGESDISTDYGYAVQGLLDNLYNVNELDLKISGGIPEDCTAIIISGPKKSLDADEYAIIKDYLDEGGWAMIMVNPNPTEDMKRLLSEWGVSVEEGTVVDKSASLSTDINSPIVDRLRNFFGFTSFYLPGPTALIPHPEYTPNIIPGGGDTPLQIIWSSENTTIAMYSLARTSSGSWLEKDFTTEEDPVYNGDEELRGPLELGLLIFFAPPLDEEGQPIIEVPPTRLVVVGDTDFASNAHFYNADNGNLFLNLVELMTAGKELIAIERKVLPFRRLVIEPEEQTFIQVTSIGLLPLLVLIAGGIIWWRRR